MKNNLEILQTSAVFRGVDAGEITSMLHCLGAKVVSCAKGEFLLHTGDAPEAVGLLLSGSLLVLQEDYWGNRNIRTRIAPGRAFAEPFACIPGAVMDVSVQADESCTVLWLQASRILTTCPTSCPCHSRIIRNLVSDLAENNLRANEKLTHLCKRTTREKLLSYLSAEAQRQGKTDFIIPFNRQQLADYLSVERSAMSAALSKMQQEGLLTMQRSHFTLL